jgi:hypothetical protein
MVTTCPKCQIHFKCAQQDPVLKDWIEIEIQDLSTLVADRLEVAEHQLFQEADIADR